MGRTMYDILIDVRVAFKLRVVCADLTDPVGLCKAAYHNLPYREYLLFKEYLIESMTKRFLGIPIKTPDLTEHLWSPTDRESRYKWLDKHILKNTPK